MTENETVDLSRLDKEVTTFINNGDVPYVPGVDPDATAPIHTSEETAVIPRLSDVPAPVMISRPPNVTALLFMLVSLVMAATLVVTLVVMLH